MTDDELLRHAAELLHPLDPRQCSHQEGHCMHCGKPMPPFLIRQCPEWYRLYWKKKEVAAFAMRDAVEDEVEDEWMEEVERISGQRAAWATPREWLEAGIEVLEKQ